MPFPGENHLEVVEKKNQGEFLAGRRAQPVVPAVLDRILARMMARQPPDRYQTVSELIVDLERRAWRPTCPPSPTPSSPATTPG